MFSQYTSEADNFEKLKKLWTKQLYIEFDRICFSQRVHLEPVTIIIADWQEKLGQWDSRARSITLSQNLLRNYSWIQVIDVLKHEMAHQMVSEFFKVYEHHGDFFQKSCKKLGVSSWASKSRVGGRMDEPKQSDSNTENSEEERMLRKAQKLLALASSSNENEAFQAMKKVQFLFENYHLKSLEKQDQSEFISVFINHKKKRMELYQTMIGSLLIKHFYVKIIHLSVYNSADAQEHKAMEIMGIKRHAQLAEYVYWFLFNQLPLLWCDFKKDRKSSGTAARNQFYQGVISGFDEKLQKSKLERKKELEKAANFSKQAQLICNEDNRLKKYVEFRHPRLKNASYSTSRHDEYTYEAGKKRGRELNLHHGLKNNASKSSKELRQLNAAKSK